MPANTTLAELLPAAHALPRPDKLRLIQLLTDDLLPTPDEVASALMPPGDYPYRSPHDGAEAAAVLQNFIDANSICHK